MSVFVTKISVILVFSTFPKWSYRSPTNVYIDVWDDGDGRSLLSWQWLLCPVWLESQTNPCVLLCWKEWSEDEHKALIFSSKVCSLFVDYLILVGLNCCGFMFVLVKLLTWSSWKGGVVWCDRFPNLILWMTVLISKWNMSRNEMKGCGREFIFLHCLFWLNLTVSKEDVNWACWKYYRNLFLLDNFWSLKVHFI